MWDSLVIISLPCTSQARYKKDSSSASSRSNPTVSRQQGPDHQTLQLFQLPNISLNSNLTLNST